MPDGLTSFEAAVAVVLDTLEPGDVVAAGGQPATDRAEGVAVVGERSSARE